MKLKGRARLTIPARALIGAVTLLAIASAGAYQLGYFHWAAASPDKQAGDEARKLGDRTGAEAVVPVTSTTVVVADVPVTIDAVGTAQALNTVTIRTQVDGRLIKLARKGKKLRKATCSL
jgi:multidrug efflux system membrane fusion protein